MAHIGSLAVEGSPMEAEEEKAEEEEALCEVEENRLGDSLKMITAYFGDLVRS